ncbi:hypothetical protein TCAL_00397 [Tigriopus californicus]|uniref:Structure-specific endonuclease subunit SLX4 n=1 Tax=Tigriopus californicus TaxID=6832 RepID=A0A553NE21_TIGCA|nr:hypothetical protein TCAL_00397 [Tigriopus californicus]|eukprot:TCALIF_00397-PA protein Name:"Similar to Slx4 Structure-specific endonuclease subunit SLX4 (Mus musculus)" AED:0.00 eAED:0.00 QI:694/1/1/1/1/1/2/32/954
MTSVGTKGGKLSRKRVRVPELNASAEEFLETNPPTQKRVSVEKGENLDVGVPLDEKVSVSGRTGLPDCPLCGKAFKSQKQHGPRSAHIKSCGIKLGLDAEKLLQLRRLEERQAQERQALGLPVVSAGPRTNHSESGVRRAIKASTHPSVSSMNIPSDPHLEMALALSASLAHEEMSKCDEEERQLQLLGVSDHKLQKMEPPPQVLISAPCPNILPAPSRLGSKAHKKPKKAKSCLEVRLPEDRLQQISEQIAMILAGESSAETRLVPGTLFAWKSFTFSDIENEKLLDWTAKRDQRWNRAAMQDAQFYNGILGSFQVENLSLGKEKMITSSTPVKLESTNEMKPTSPVIRVKAITNEHFQALSNDLASLLKCNSQSDVTIICQNDAEVKCHSLILFLRCPLLREYVVTEEANGRSQRVLAWPDVSEEATKLFLSYLYSANLPRDIDRQTVLNQLRTLAKKYRVKLLHGFLGDLNVDHMMSEREEEEIEKIDICRGKTDGLEGPNCGGVLGEHEESFNIYGNEASQEHLVKVVSGNSLTTPDLRVQFKTEDSKALSRALVNVSNLSTGGFIEPNGGSPVKLDQSLGTAYASDEDLFASDKEESEEDVQNQPRSLSPASSDIGNSLVKKPDSTHELTMSSPFKIVSPTPTCEKVHTGESGDNDDGKDVWADFEVDGGEISVEATPEEEWIERQDMPDPKVASTPHSCTPSPLSERRESLTESCTPPKKLTSKSPENFGRITPMLDYDRMLSPALRRELYKFGLKAIPRRKAVQILTHIYEETHPLVEDVRSVDDTEGGDGEKEIEPIGEGSASQESIESSKSDLPEESIFLSLEERDGPGQSQVLAPDEDIDKIVLNYIKANDELHKQVLLFEPIWLESFLEDLKRSRPELKRLKLNQLTDIFDVQCITFRTAARAKRKQKKSPKKTKSKANRDVSHIKKTKKSAHNIGNGQQSTQ